MGKFMRKKRVIVVFVVLLMIFLVAPLALSIYIYHSNFHNRYETISWMKWDQKEFEGLQGKRHEFPSNQGQKLVGYTYYREKEEAKGVIILAHGLGGGGHNSYMDVANYFTKKDYLVFAYDATGNDESEGDSVKGIPQAVIDLDYAIRFVKRQEQFQKLPIMLFGHSWGAYATGSVLNVHPDIKGVVMIAGFNHSMDIIEEEGERIMGKGIQLLVPYLSFIERIKFHKYASYNCQEGFAGSDAGVMMIHSVDDEAVSFHKQYKVFSEMYDKDPRFIFVQYQDRGHDYLLYSDDAKKYRKQFNTQFEKFTKELDTELTPEVKTDYMEEHLDKSKLFQLDDSLMDKITDFYDGYTKP